MWKRFVMAIVVLSWTMASHAGPGPGQVSEASAHYDLEQLYAQNQHDEGLTLAKEKHSANPDDIDLYWHIPRFLFEIGERYDRHDSSVNKVELYKEMIDWAERGLERDANHPHLWFALGVGKGRLSTTKGILGMLGMLADIEEAFLKTAESGYEYKAMGTGEHLPCHAYNTLGIFYRLVPDSWFVKALAGTRGSLQKSLEWMEKANTCSPNRIGIIKELAVTRLCMGSSKKDTISTSLGLALLNQARVMPPQTDTERIDLKHIDALLQDSSIACGYSRDGQQERDDAELRKNNGR